MARIGSVLVQTVAWPVLLLGVGWAALALWIDGPAATWLAEGLALGLVLWCLICVVLLRPIWRAQVAIAAVILAVVGWWLTIPPRNDRDWLPDVARPARATIAGNRVTIGNVRNFDYRTETDYTERWETRTYDLTKLRGADLFLAFWGPTLIAHTIASWEFVEGLPLAISIETRKEKGEEYSALRGFFRQYELYYVVADERDVVRLRTNYRGEQVFLYRLRMGADQARAILLDYLREINRLADEPTWYNALTHNCTTTIRHHAQQVASGRPWDWRILANGRLDELGYERGQIDTSLPFAELKGKSDITARAKAADAAADFSRRIREGLPGMAGSAPSGG